MTKAKEDDIVVSVPGIPRGNAIDYLQTLDIPVSVDNRTKHTIFMEKITLRFQPEWTMPGCDAFVDHKCPGFEVGAKKEEYRNVQVRPSPLFMEASNYFDVMLVYRRADASAKLRSIVRQRVTYIVTKDPPAVRGQAFISYKDPEDADLKNMMKIIARRVGFSPYVAPDDCKPGTAIWEEKIPAAIKASNLCFVLCTGRTDFGKGVHKELTLCKKACIRIVPLIEAGTPTPREFESLTRELTHFARESAPARFSQAAIACL